MPKISIIIPTYNNECYLRECLESVTRQTLHDIEIICVNDGSTDNTRVILQEYAAVDDRFVIIDKPNAGYGAALNDGMDAATGEYIGIVESDDYVAADMYEKLWNAVEAHPGIDAVRADYYRFWGAGVSERTELVHISDKRAYYERTFAPCHDLGVLRFNTNNQSGIYRTDFLRNNDIRLNETPGASYQDNGLFFKIYSLAESALLLDTPLYRLRRDNDASSVNNKGKVFCICEEFDLNRTWAIKRGLSRGHLEMAAVLRFSNYQWTEGRIAHEYKYDFCKRLASDFRILAEKGELNRYRFRPLQWEDLQFALRDVERYYYSRWVEGGWKRIRDLEENIIQLEKQVDAFRYSKSWKVGRMITALPRAITQRDKEFREKLPMVTLDQLAGHERDIAILDEYYRCTRDVYDDADPRTFGQKLQWMKLHNILSYQDDRMLDNEIQNLIYQVVCFSGKPYAFWVDIFEDGMQYRNVYSLDWELQPIVIGVPNYSRPLDQPLQITEMLKEAKRLSQDQLCALVCFTCEGDMLQLIKIGPDLYSGFELWSPPEANLIYGEQINTKCE